MCLTRATASRPQGRAVAPTGAGPHGLRRSKDEARRHFGRTRQPAGREPRGRLPAGPPNGSKPNSNSTGTTPGSTGPDGAETGACAAIAFDGDTRVHRRQRRTIRLPSGLLADRFVAQPVPEALPRDQRPPTHPLHRLHRVRFDHRIRPRRPDLHVGHARRPAAVPIQGREVRSRRRRRAPCCSTSFTSTTCTATTTACT